VIKKREKFMMFMEKRVSKKTNKEKIKVEVVDLVDINTSTLMISSEEVEEEVAEVIISVAVTTSTSNKFTRTYLKTQM
jgi:tellurite resistance protein